MTEPQTIFAPHPEKHKESLVSPVEQWDGVCIKLMRDALAPKGFSEIKRGPWKGRVQANVHFLSKQTVEATGNLAAHLVRSFRSNTKKAILQKVAEVDKSMDEYRSELGRCRFWEFKKKRFYKNSLWVYGYGKKCYETALEQLFDTGIK